MPLSVNPAYNSIAAGMLKQMGVEYEFPVILGHDYAGVVEEVGSDVTRYSVGDEVFGFLLHADPTVHDGSWAELIAVPQDMFIGRAPAGVDVAIRDIVLAARSEDVMITERLVRRRGPSWTSLEPVSVEGKGRWPKSR